MKTPVRPNGLRGIISTRSSSIPILALIVIAVAVGVGIAIKAVPTAIYCGILSGQEMDLCRLMEAPRTDPDACERIGEPIMRDVCVRSSVAFPVRISSLPEHKDPCNSIGNLFLEYECLRASFRPHMWEFLPNPALEKRRFESDGQLEEYIGALAVSTEAAHTAGINIEGAELLCSQLLDLRTQGECMFLVASALVMGLAGDSGDDIGRHIDDVMDLCSRVSDINWKSECYYVLADELALTGRETLLGDIGRACEESTRVVDYSCFGHVLYFLPISQRGAFCSQIPQDHKPRCYRDFGSAFAHEKQYNMSLMEGVCALVPSGYGDECQTGFAEAVGSQLIEPLAANVELCDEFLGEPRQHCFKYLGIGISSRYLHDPSKVISFCEVFPEDAKRDCFLTSGSMMNQRYGDDIPRSIRECDMFPKEYKGWCLGGLSTAIGRRAVIDSDLPGGIEQCEMLPSALLKECLTGLSSAIVEFSGNEMLLKISQCEEFPRPYHPLCFSQVIEDIYRRSLQDSAVIKECEMLPAGFREPCSGFNVYSYDTYSRSNVLSTSKRTHLRFYLAEGAEPKELLLRYSAHRPVGFEKPRFSVSINGILAANVSAEPPYPWDILKVPLSTMSMRNGTLDVLIQSNAYVDENGEERGVALDWFSIPCGEGPGCILDWEVLSGRMRNDTSPAWEPSRNSAGQTEGHISAFSTAPPSESASPSR